MVSKSVFSRYNLTDKLEYLFRIFKFLSGRVTKLEQKGDSSSFQTGSNLYFDESGTLKLGVKINYQDGTMENVNGEPLYYMVASDPNQKKTGILHMESYYIIESFDSAANYDRTSLFIGNTVAYMESGSRRISMSKDTIGVVVEDSKDYVGLSYGRDYSEKGKLYPRWIPDWGTVENYVINSVPEKSKFILPYNRLGLPSEAVTGDEVYKAVFYSLDPNNISIDQAVFATIIRGFIKIGVRLTGIEKAESVTLELNYMNNDVGFYANIGRAEYKTAGAVAGILDTELLFDFSIERYTNRFINVKKRDILISKNALQPTKADQDIKEIMNYTSTGDRNPSNFKLQLVVKAKPKTGSALQDIVFRVTSMSNLTVKIEV